MAQDTITPARVPAWSRRQISIDRATAKAHEQSRVDNLPTLLRSRRDADGGCRPTRLAAGIETLCDCAAAESDRICWHRAACRLAHLGELAYHDAATGRTLAPLTPDEEADLLPAFDPDPADAPDWTALAAG